MDWVYLGKLKKNSKVEIKGIVLFRQRQIVFDLNADY